MSHRYVCIEGNVHTSSRLDRTPDTGSGAERWMCDGQTTGPPEAPKAFTEVTISMGLMGMAKQA